jgi:hypothetical protein
MGLERKRLKGKQGEKEKKKAVKNAREGIKARRRKHTPLLLAAAVLVCAGTELSVYAYLCVCVCI